MGKGEAGMGQAGTEQSHIGTEHRTYLCIDLKSFYASVECVEQGFDPMTTKLVVADPERTEKTICLAVSPAMKELGVPNRCRVFQIPSSIDYRIAPPRMQLYIEYSANIYAIYLKYFSKEDIHVYSIDEVFIDVTDYLTLYQMTARQLGKTVMEEILRETGIPSSCGIGTNLYLAKIALDITAKHSPERIGILDEESYRRELWEYKPLEDFWRIGKGTVRRLQSAGIHTMKEIAQAEEELLFRMFGIDAELLIDHAWGKEPTTIADIKQYKPKQNSLTSGQVLPCDYNFEDGCLIVKEMADMLALELVEKGLVTDSITLHVGYNNALGLPSAHGTITMSTPNSSGNTIMDHSQRLYQKIVDANASIRRIHLTFNRVWEEGFQQYDLFTDPEELEKEHKIQQAMLDIKKRFGKNAILKGMSLQEQATGAERNQQIGGHKSGA